MSEKKLALLRILFMIVIVAAVALVGMALVPADSLATLTGKPPAPPEEVRLVNIMHRMDARIERLYHSGYKEEWGEARDNLAELGEIASLLYGQDVYWDQSNISAVMESLMPQQIDNLGATIDRRDREAFLETYRTMVAVCNSCHRATRQLVVIQEPPAPRD